MSRLKKNEEATLQTTHQLSHKTTQHNATSKYLQYSIETEYDAQTKHPPKQRERVQGHGNTRI